MKALVEEELNGATNYANLTTEDGVLYADPRTVKAMTNSLRTTFNTITSGGDSKLSTTNPRFLSKGFACESRSYGPLIHLLNKIIGTANQHIPPVESQLAKLSFHAFGREIKGTYSSQKGLKPDIMGILGPLGKPSNKEKKCSKNPTAPSKVPKLTWEEIEVTVESKASVPDLVQQSGMYSG